MSTSPRPRVVNYDGKRQGAVVIEVQTFKGDEEIKFSSAQNCWTIFRSVIAALGDHNANRKNIKAIICSLKP